MSSLNLRNIYKVYPSGVTAVTDFNLDIEDKEFIIFVGPSGCGKSTTLRMIAGLEEISKGELYIDGILVNNRAPKDRDIAMVFQNYALYPHMTVFDNMAFGLKLRRVPKPEIERKVREAARILGLEMYLQRKPKALSGGQRQRVALGRAIVREPKVFLLDEPLSNLDAKLRSQMRTEITKLHNRLATTFIYVTHDQVEAMTMGTRIVVMKDGFMQQVDTPMNLYDYPVNVFVAGFIGSPRMNFFPGQLVGTPSNVSVQIGEDKIELPKEKIALICNLEKYLNTGKEILFGIRPEDVHDNAEEIKEKKYATINARVDIVEALGAETLLYCTTLSEAKKQSADGSLDDEVSNLIARVGNRTEIVLGEQAKLGFDMKHCHLFDKETEVTIVAKNANEKQAIIDLQAKSEEAQAEKAAKEAEKAAEELAKAEKKRFKLGKKAKKANVVDGAIADVDAEDAVMDVVVAEAVSEEAEEKKGE